MNLLNGVYLLNAVIGVNGVILMYGDDWDEFGDCGVYLVNEVIGVNGVIWRMYRVNWKNVMNLVNGLYLVNEVIGVNGVIWMYGVNWENGMNLANVGYVENGVNLINGIKLGKWCELAE